MRVTTLVSAAAIAFTASMGISSAADRAPGASAETFVALKGVQATQMNPAEMAAVTGAFNLFRFDRTTGTAIYVGTHGGNFQHTPGFNNVIVGCGGPPRMTTFQNPGC